MILGVLSIGLKQIVIHVLHRDLGLNPGQAHSLELQHHQRAGGILGKRLIYAQRHGLSGHGSPTNQVGLNQLLREILPHEWRSQPLPVTRYAPVLDIKPSARAVGAGNRL